MDDEMRTQLEAINQNLNAIIINQAILYCRLEDIEQRIKTESQFPDRT